MSQPDEFQREVGDSERYWGKVLATAEGQGSLDDTGVSARRNWSAGTEEKSKRVHG